MIYTFGTGLREAEEFLRILKGYGVRTVIDVRRFPISKLPQFKKQNFRKMLEGNGLIYVYLGQKLGGYRIDGYQSYIQTSEFVDGINELESIAQKSISCVVCAERFPWRCHRRFISFELMRRGWEVIHIIDEKRIWKIK